MMMHGSFAALLFLLLVEISISFSIPANSNQINVDRPTTEYTSPGGPESPEEGSGIDSSLTVDMGDYNGYVSDPSAEAGIVDKLFYYYEF